MYKLVGERLHNFEYDGISVSVTQTVEYTVEYRFSIAVISPVNTGLCF